MTRLWTISALILSAALGYQAGVVMESQSVGGAAGTVAANKCTNAVASMNNKGYPGAIGEVIISASDGTVQVTVSALCIDANGVTVPIRVTETIVPLQ